MKTDLKIDISSGGNGDIWMRLVSFFSVSVLLTDVQIYLYVPPFMERLSKHAFGDRLKFLKDRNECTLFYTSLGLKSIIGGILAGKKYVAPYHRAVIEDKGERELKDNLNILLFNLAHRLKLVHLPSWQWLKVYQGYSDIIGIKEIMSLSYQQYSNQLETDSEEVFSKLCTSEIPYSKELRIPSDLEVNLLVFPNGTSRQFIPIWWAKKYLPNAYYAFFIKDEEAVKFQDSGLKVVFFYSEPGDILFLSHNARWTISTDSFPSHLLQYGTKRCTVLLTEVLKSRVVSPVFKGVVIDSEAKCHPCLHLDRKNNPTCMAGYIECINWKNLKYSQNVLSSIPVPELEARE